MYFSQSQTSLFFFCLQTSSTFPPMQPYEVLSADPLSPDFMPPPLRVRSQPPIPDRSDSDPAATPIPRERLFIDVSEEDIAVAPKVPPPAVFSPIGRPVTTRAEPPSIKQHRLLKRTQSRRYLRLEDPNDSREGPVPEPVPEEFKNVKCKASCKRRLSTVFRAIKEGKDNKNDDDDEFVASNVGIFVISNISFKEKRKKNGHHH